MKKYLPIILGLLTGLLIYGTYHKGYKKGISKVVETVVEWVDTCVVHDTLLAYKPVPYNVYVVDTLFVPVPGETDTLWVPLPREAKEYRDPGDTLYRAVVSGYEPSLDTLEVYRKTTTITVNNIVKEYTNPRWSVGVQAGYGVTKSGLSPYIGVGVQYNLINIKGRL